VGLLYHASMDDKVKAMFTNTDCIPMVHKNLWNLYIYNKLERNLLHNDCTFYLDNKHDIKFRGWTCKIWINSTGHKFNY